MTAFLSREQGGYSGGGMRKKIKQYSYSSGDRIGKGYSSVVYLGKNDSTDEAVAIKAIDMKGVKDSVSREMLDCEIQALTKLRHPNILRCYDVIREPSHCYIVTEYCQQGDLSSILKKKRKMPEQDVMAIVRDIVAGYVEIGENRFLHRDLKLANIFVGEKGVAKIADFGFAKKSFSSSEKEKYNVGSPLYMSPQALKKNIYSVKNDIWSIGIMVYELLHGETPWECKTEAELIDKMTKIPVKFRSHVPVSDLLKDFVRRCLEVDESKRMSLSELKEWAGRHAHHRSQSFSDKPVPVLEDKKSAKEGRSSEDGVRVLGDATNRFSMGVEKNRSYSNVMGKGAYESKNVSAGQLDKENNYNSQKMEKNVLAKAVVDKNNMAILIEINKFRLMFKIYEKLKKLAPEESTLQSVLGNEILGRVQTVADVLLRSGEEGSKKKAERLGVAELERYTREELNPGIKKYVSVIKEYQKKYSAEVEVPTTSNFISCGELLRKYLGEHLGKGMGKEENLVCYWMFEWVAMAATVKKEDLDAIIEGKKMLSSEVLASKFKELL